MRKEILSRRTREVGAGGCATAAGAPEGAAALIGCRLEWPQWHWVSVNGNRREPLGQVLAKRAGRSLPPTRVAEKCMENV